MSPGLVLIVDDDPDILASLRELLEADGLTVELAADGREALEAVLARPPQLLLVDLMMPVLDGRQLVEELRRRGVNVPVLLLSAGRELHRTGRELGLPVIEKPFDLDELLEQVHAALGR